MKSYEKLRRQRDETIFQVKRVKHMIKTIQEETKEIRSDVLAGQYKTLKKANILDELIKTLEELYEIE